MFKSLKLKFRPPQLHDADFGELTFMYISNHPERSYWEGEWLFPPTQTRVGIALDGDESGPRPESREWYLELPNRSQNICELARPRLVQVFKSWLNEELPEDIFSALTLAGFDVVDPQSNPIEWSVAFETVGKKWLYINIPFIGSDAQEPIIDT